MKENEKNTNAEEKKNNKKGLKAAIIIVSILLAIILIFEGVVFLASRVVFKKLGMAEADASAASEAALTGVPATLSNAVTANFDAHKDSLKNSKNVVNILVAAKNKDGKGLSMVLLLSINKKKDTIYTYYYLPTLCVKDDTTGDLRTIGSINSPETLKAIMEQNFGMTISRYIVMTSDALAAGIDKLGGVTISSAKFAATTAEELADLNGYLTTKIDAVPTESVSLNGAQTVEYMAYLNDTVTSGATVPQNAVVYELVRSFAKKNIFNVTSFLKAAGKEAQTNLNASSLTNGAFMMAVDSMFFSYAVNSVSPINPYSQFDANGTKVTGSANYVDNTDAVLKVLYPDGSSGLSLNANDFLLILAAVHCFDYPDHPVQQERQRG